MTPYDILASLHATLLARREHGDPKESYVAKLLAKGMNKIAQKVGEEGVEVAIAGIAQDDAHVIDESADLVFHLWVLLVARGIDPARVMDEIARRYGTSGLIEKKSRPE